MINRQWFVNYDLDNVKMFVDRALSVDDKYVRIASGEVEIEIVEDNFKTEFEKDEFDDDSYDLAYAEYEHATDVLLAYQEIVVRAALNEINSIAEYELKVISSFIKHKASGESLNRCWVKERKDACKVIENTHNIRLKDLPGFTEVDKVRKIINAYKHDYGYSGEYKPFVGKYIEIEKQYELDVDEINKCVDAAKVFLASIPGDRPGLGEESPRRLKFNKNIWSNNELE